MKFRYLFLLLAFCFNTGWADFSNTQVGVHPLYVAANEPYLIEIRGEWPTDCHPGEQKPIISEYTGDSALIEFEIIVDHVTCNDVVTPYRVLVDMSDVVDGVVGEFVDIDITVRFEGADLERQVPLVCNLCDPPPPPRDIKPEPGLYYSDGLEKQGLLLARQNQRMGAFPLIYDETGSSEWVIGAGGIVEDVFFADLLESTGGQCLGCLPPDEPPQMGVVGKISMLMDSEGIVQVKINDGLFETYEPLVYGYGELKIGGNPRTSIPDLSGRWAFSESDVGGNPNLSIPPIYVLPLVFDITVESVFFMRPVIVLEPPTPPGDATYLISDIEGVEVVRMKCTNFDYDPTKFADEVKITCRIYDAEFDGEGTPSNLLFSVELSSPERMVMTYANLVLGVGVPSRGTAVRID